MNNIRFNFCRIILLTFLCFIITFLFFGCSKKSSDIKISSKDEKSEGDISGKEEMVIKLFFLNGSESAFEERTVFFNSGKPSEKISAAINALIEGSKEGLLRTLPEKTKLLNAFVDEDGVAYLNFSKDITRNNIGGTFSELATINSILHTLVENFEEISAVQILINREEANTLSGHIDISKPLKVKGFSETTIKP